METRPITFATDLILQYIKLVGLILDVTGF